MTKGANAASPTESQANDLERTHEKSASGKQQIVLDYDIIYSIM